MVYWPCLSKRGPWCDTRARLAACRFTSLHKEPRIDLIAGEPESSLRHLDYCVVKPLVDIAILPDLVSHSTVRRTEATVAHISLWQSALTVLLGRTPRPPPYHVHLRHATAVSAFAHNTQPQPRSHSVIATTLTVSACRKSSIRLEASSASTVVVTAGTRVPMHAVCTMLD
jgi:hypothetical protein